MRKFKFICSALLACGLTGAAWADLKPIKGDTGERLDSLETKTQNVFAKAGILFGGEFYSRAMGSKISGPITEDSTSVQTNKTTENLLYTGLDLSINARPLDAIGGIAIIRMQQDWRNMFGSMANPLTLRWITIEGNAKNIFTYSVGDFKQKYTPLTLWTPEPNIMFEPTIFARQREIAMNEEFLGDNNRAMQGANFNFGAKVAPALQELRFGAFAARLRSAGSGLAGEKGDSPIEDGYGARMDRFATGFNTDMKFVPGTQIGGTILYVGDAKRTSTLSGDSATWTNANNNMVLGGRARIGSELFRAIDADAVNFGLGAEFANSNYTMYPEFDKEKNEAKDSTISGTAFKGNLDAKFKFGQNGLKLNAGFMQNTQEFRSELAQSPALFKRTILNTALDKDPFNIFDALYTSAFTYMPGEGEKGTTKQPMKKGAWTRSTLTWEELVNNPNIIERNLSGALPFGEATPNRSGIVADLDLDFVNKAILLSGIFNMLEEHQVDTTFSPHWNKKATQSFMEFGGGASLNIAKFGDWWAYPFILSGSFKHTVVDNYLDLLDLNKEPPVGEEIDYKNTGYTNNVSFMNAGLYWKFWKSLALMGGYQFVNSVAKTTVEMTTNQSQWAAGLEYTVAEGGVLNATVGQVAVDYSAKKKAENDEVIKNNFKSLRLDLSLRVKF
jgi:hypothetical protein